MDRSVIVKKIIMVIITLLVIAYVIFQVSRASFTQVKTVSAKETVAYDSFTADCYVVRDETMIEYSGDGIISYNHDDGAKVSVNEAVAGVFENADSAGKKKDIEHLKEQIEELEWLQKNLDNITQSPDELDKAIGNNLVEANQLLNTGDLSEVNGNIERVVYYINERQLVTGKTTDYNERINKLKKKLDELEKSSAKQKKSMEIKSPVTGYFVGSADGYENIIKTSQLKSLKPSDIEGDAIKPINVPSKVIGKTINGVYWYLVCKVTPDDILKLKNNPTLKLDIPVVSSQKINVELYSINQEKRDSDGVAVFRGTMMNDEMASFRRGEISVIVEEYSGISIPKSAVHDKEITKLTEDSSGNVKTDSKTVTGVYVKLGNSVSFREIFPIYSGENIVISDTDKNLTPFSNEFGKLEVYDEIIVEGANLYDGKIIQRSS